MRPLYLSRRLAAKYVRDNYGMRCSEKWLAKLAVTGGGPTYWKEGRTVLYRAYALDAWVANRISGPLSSSSDIRPNSKATVANFLSSEGMPFADI